MTYALAVPESPRRSPLFGTRAQLAAGNGDVEGYLALASCDRRAGTASYALRLVNQSPHPLRARMSCARLRGETVTAYPLDVNVAPFSIAETLLPVRIADVGPYDRAIVQVAGGDIAFSLEAPAPPRNVRRARWITAIAVLATVLGLACGAALAPPHLALLATPAVSIAGTPVDVPYAFGGLATMQYALQTPDGRQISAGLESARQGTLHFSIPPIAGKNVDLAINLWGPFGHVRATRKLAIAALPAPQPARSRESNDSPPPRIDAFALQTPSVHAGDTLRVAYSTNAATGDVWLLDESGRLWARAAISPSGVSTIEVPQGAAGRQMRTVLHVRSGGRDTVSSLALLVLPAAVSETTQPPAESTTASGQSSPGIRLDVSSENAAPGDSVTVSLFGDHGDARVSLTDEMGNTVAQGDVPAGQTAVTLTAPTVEKSKTFYVIADITQGVAEQTLVKKLVVAPR